MHRGGETTGRTPAFECVGLGMSYTLPGRTVEALQEISLRQEPGEFVCMVAGPSGSGDEVLELPRGTPPVPPPANPLPRGDAWRPAPYGPRFPRTTVFSPG